uniref:Prostate and testis expressed 3 n=1 Tax=Suricata suricatta TaxID=37032 RepID=A0A673U7X6_SURSU
MIVRCWRFRPQRSNVHLEIETFHLLDTTLAISKAAVTPLKCITCHLRTRTDRCRRGFDSCTAQKFESCMSLKIFQDNILQLSYMVCQKFCRDLTFDLNNRTYVHKCCKYNYCNSKI